MLMLTSMSRLHFAVNGDNGGAVGLAKDGYGDYGEGDGASG